VRLDEPEVLDHAHPEVPPIALVQLLEPLAREGGALEAELDPALPQQVAIALEEGAPLVPGPAPLAVGHADALGLDVGVEGGVGHIRRVMGQKLFLAVSQHIGHGRANIGEYPLCIVYIQHVFPA
jgi:hypothetical protein